MSELLLHPKTAAQYTLIGLKQPHGILIAGVEGSGKETLALNLASKLLDTITSRLASHPYFLRINPKGESISIDDIRALQQFLKLKVPKNSLGIARVILIERAERMRTEAQNALLKTLEEPPHDTCIVLTAGSSEQLLPTISSRTQELVIMSVSEKQAIEFFGNTGKASGDIKKYYALSQGQVGLLHALLFDQDHPLTRQVEIAKHILAESIAQRLLRIDELVKDKQQVKLLLNAFSRIAHAALVHAAQKQNSHVVQQWHQRQAVMIEASTRFVYNPNLKLLLDDLFINI